MPSSKFNTAHTLDELIFFDELDAHILEELEAQSFLFNELETHDCEL